MTGCHGDQDAIAADVELVYAGCPGLIAVTTLPDRATRFYPSTEMAKMATYIAAASATQNTYTMVCTLGTRPARGRGGAADTVALPGLVLDLDIAGPAHADVSGRLRLPADPHEALAVLDQMPLAPTEILDTGHGLLARFLFATPMVFTTGEERANAADLSRQWNAHAVDLGRARGLHVDDVGDLARLARLAGSWNRKAEPVPVRVVEVHPRRRYRPQELAEALPARRAPTAPPAPAQSPIRAPHPDTGESPAEAFSRLVSWAEILEPHGFSLMRDADRAGYWRHYSASSPAGTPSASTDVNGVPVLVLFSESAAAATGLPVGAGNRLTRFRCWSILNYGGDEAAAARALRTMARSAS